MTDWPVTALDPVRRLRVLAAGLPAALYAEARLDLPFTAVWPAVTLLAAGHHPPLDVVLRPGLCLLQGDHVLAATAAAPEGTGTRLALLAALRPPPTAAACAVR
ncbi:hypothetical protein [Streptomyces sp. NPDC046939]|uniref:hypothetical protein n=1 Tax=Streptomyces sp. NPDC046939 TaxID=3155376 RepID=UPI0034091A15